MDGIIGGLALVLLLLVAFGWYYDSKRSAAGGTNSAVLTGTGASFVSHKYPLCEMLLKAKCTLLESK